MLDDKNKKKKEITKMCEFVLIFSLLKYRLGTDINFGGRKMIKFK